jgi:hypothetical protein
MTTKPDLIKWVTDDSASKISDPGSTKKLSGWLYKEEPAHQFWNWVWNKVSKWLLGLQGSYFDIVIGSSAQVTAHEATHEIDDLDDTLAVSGSKILFLDGTHTLAANLSLANDTIIINSEQSAIIDIVTYTVDIGGIGCIVKADFANAGTGDIVIDGVGSKIVAINNQIRQFVVDDSAVVVVSGASGAIKARNINGLTKTLQNISVREFSENSSSDDKAWVSVAWSPELHIFCAVAGVGSGDVMTSPDGINWTTGTPAQVIAWTDLTWSPELSLFCAVAGNGTNRIMTSPDGINWTTRVPDTDELFKSISWSPELGLFCIVASSGTGTQVKTSPDGTNWTSQTEAETNDWQDVCWSPELGLFCSVSGAGTNRVMTSPDGINWSAQAHAADGSWEAVCWSGELGLFCAVARTGAGDQIMTSPDGINWTSHTQPVDSQWTDICWSPDLLLFCAIADLGPGTNDQIITSTDGIIWDIRSTSGDYANAGVSWSPELGLFCIVGGTTPSNKVLISR